jgi:acetyl esterase/lipase
MIAAPQIGAGMKSRYLVDPDLLGVFDTLPTIDLTMELLPAIRAAGLPLLVQAPTPGASDLVRRRIPGPAAGPEVEVAIYTPRPRAETLPCLLHIHGGGYVTGSTKSLEPIHRMLAVAADCCIVSVDYRLAPETHFPGAIEDCYAALSWVFKEAGTLGVDSSRIGVMGESAGGGLAAALALLARDRREHPLAFQQLIYPMLDDRTCVRETPHPYAGEFLWTAHNNAFGWSALLGVAPGSAQVSAYAAAARAENLSGLPPTFISTGGLDLFLDEDMDYAQRLMRHGVPVELHVYAGAYHGFDFLTNAPVAVAARRDSLSALRRFLHPRQAAA